LYTLTNVFGKGGEELVAERGNATALKGAALTSPVPIYQNIAADASAPREVRARALLLAGWAR
jgi:hypothetical protein